VAFIEISISIKNNSYHQLVTHQPLQLVKTETNYAQVYNKVKKGRQS